MRRRRRFLFLVLDEHPWGREMLRRLLAADLRPELLLVETGELAEIERRKFLARLGEHPAAPTLEQQAGDASLPVRRVPAHTDPHCLEAIRAAAPGLIVLGGTRIIRGEMLDEPEDGVLNAHPGLLPECRGSASPAWSVHRDIPIGASCHFCTAAIDEGDLVGRREIAVHRGDSYEDLCYRTLVEAGRLMREALEAWRDGRLESLRHPQGSSPHPTFRDMRAERIEKVRQKLRNQTYAHYVD